MNFHGASAVHHAQGLAMIAHENHRAKERRVDGPSDHDPESPTLAGYIVYVVTVMGFVIMCVLCGLR
jgi:hypothetical protein